VMVGVVTACVLFAFEIRHLPPAMLLTGLVVIGSLAALARTLTRAWREQRLLRRLPATPVGETRYADLQAEAGAVPIGIVPASAVNAFCAGILRPRVLVTSGLLERLDADEQRAAIVHELEHARSRGPLKVALARMTARSFFWVPALRDLADRYVLLCELEADRAAVARTGRAALAGALLEVIESPRLAGAVGLADFAAPRIDRLFDPHAALPPLFRRSSLLAALGAIAGAAALVLSLRHLGSSESMHLHAMSVQLLVHRIRDRLLGLAGMTAGATLVMASWRRVRASAHRRVDQRRSDPKIP
jgi:hypothetical protein